MGLLRDVLERLPSHPNSRIDQSNDSGQSFDAAVTIPM